MFEGVEEALAQAAEIAAVVVGLPDCLGSLSTGFLRPGAKPGHCRISVATQAGYVDGHWDHAREAFETVEQRGRRLPQAAHGERLPRRMLDFGPEQAVVG